MISLLALSAAIGSSQSLLPSASYACSCARPAAQAAFDASAAVFVGELTEIRGPTVRLSSNSERRLIYAVSTVFKGDVFALQSVATQGEGASCGLEGEVGVEYLVFGGTGTQFPGVPDPGEFGAQLCSGTQRLSEAEVPQAFGTGIAPKSGSSPIGQDDFIGSELARNWYWVAIAAVAAGSMTMTLRRRRRARQVLQH